MNEDRSWNPISIVLHSQCGDILEAAPGIEPGDKGFAILCLTTWLCRHVESITYLNTKDNIDKYKVVG